MQKYGYILLICLVGILSFSSCTGSDISSQTDNTVPGTAQETSVPDTSPDTQSPEWERRLAENAEKNAWKRGLTEGEKQALFDEMPEIVFVKAEHFYDENIHGYYVLKTGEIRLFDFRNTAPDEIYEIADVYDRLEEVECEYFEFRNYSYSVDEAGRTRHNIVFRYDLRDISEDEIIDCYNRLKYTNGLKKEYTDELHAEAIPSYHECCGIRDNNGKKEMIYLSGDECNYIYNRDISDEVWEDLHNDVHHFFWSNVIYDKEVPAAELSDDEKQALLDEMPEIVFVMSEHYDENICGFYVTKTGEIKMYDFRNIAPDEIYDINDVYDRLEEAGCGSVVPKTGATEYYLPADSTGTVDTDTLIRSYIRLKEATAGAKTVYTQEKLEHTPDCRYYGIRNSADGTEIILLGGGGADHELISTDKDVNRLCSDIVPWFPRMLLYP